MLGGLSGILSRFGQHASALRGNLAPTGGRLAHSAHTSVRGADYHALFVARAGRGTAGLAD
jgi:hypothetical protein